MDIRLIAAYHASMLLTETIQQTLELLDGPASIRNPDKTIELLQAALTLTQPAIEMAATR